MIFLQKKLFKMSFAGGGGGGGATLGYITGNIKWIDLILLVANYFADTNWCKKPEQMTETLTHGYSSESLPVSTNMSGLI